MERALATLRRRGVQPQLGLLKSTMLQLDPSFNERAYGTGSFSDFVDKLETNGYLATTGPEGRKTIEVKQVAEAIAEPPKKDEALPLLRQVVDIYKLDLEDGATADDLAGWMTKIHPTFDAQKYGFQSFGEFLNFAQDNYLVRVEADAVRGLIAYPGRRTGSATSRCRTEHGSAGCSRSQPPREAPAAEASAEAASPEPEEDEKPKRGTTRKRTTTTKKAAASGSANGSTTVRRPRARKPVE